MTRWPYGLVEIALDSLFAGLAIGMGLDARARFRQLRQRADMAADRNAEHDPGEGRVSAVRRKLDHDEEAPPAA